MVLVDAGATDAPAPAESPLLAVDGLCTVFPTPAGPIRAVDGLSISLARGRTLGIVGESGSGKSVFIRSIMGLASRHGAQVTGSVRLDGQELVGLSQRQLRSLRGNQMAVIFQDPMTSLNPVVRIGRQITESLQVHLGFSRSRARERGVELLNSVGIPLPERRMRQYPHELSGGMRQRVVIAIALACEPDLLLADEPTTALDVTVQAQILELLAEQQRARDMAMVLVTHDLGVVATRADEIAVMYAGRIVEQAPTRTLFREMRMPYTAALLDSIPSIDQPSHTRLVAIGGRPPDLAQPPSGCRFAPRCPYVKDRCRAEEPPLAQDSPGHLFRCWYPLDISVRSSARPAPVGAA